MDKYIVKAAPFAVNIVDEEQRIVEGYIGDDKIDIDGHMIDRSAYEAAMQDYVQWGNIREMHKNPVGVLVSYGEKGWNHIVVKVVDDNAWKLVKERVYKGFSIGARVISTSWVGVRQVPSEYFASLPEMIKTSIIELGKILKIDSLAITEISLVDRPANPRAIILAHKGLDTNTLDSLPVDPQIMAAQELFYKGATEMAKKTTQAQEVVEQATEAIETVEKAAETEVQQENVVPEFVEREVEKALENPETATVQDVAQETVMINEAMMKMMEELTGLREMFDGVSQMLQDRMAAIEANVAALMSEEVMQEEDDNNDDVAPVAQPAMQEMSVEPVVVKSAVTEIEKTVTQQTVAAQTPAVDMDELIAKAVNSAIEKYVKTVETNHERKNVVNNGDVTKNLEEEAPQEPEFTRLNTRDKYNTLARAMASSLAN